MFDGMGKNASVAVGVTDISDKGDDKATAKLDYTWTFGPDRTLRYDADRGGRRSPATTGTSSGPRPTCTPSSAPDRRFSTATTRTS